jgi:hypothetical protein
MASAPVNLLQVRHPANSSSLHLPTMQALLFWSTAMKIPPAAYTGDGASIKRTTQCQQSACQQAAAQFSPLLSCVVAGVKAAIARAGNSAVTGYPLHCQMHVPASYLLGAGHWFLLHPCLYAACACIVSTRSGALVSTASLPPCCMCLRHIYAAKLVCLNGAAATRAAVAHCHQDSRRNACTKASTRRPRP